MSASWLFPVALFVLTIYLAITLSPFAMVTFVIFLISLTGIRVIFQYERAVLFRFGTFKGILSHGLRYIIPVVEKLEKIDLRVITIDVPSQEAITKDNVSVAVNAVLYFKVFDIKKAVLEVQKFVFATTQLAQTTMRSVVGEVELDTLLSERQKVSEEIRKIVDGVTDKWGVDVTAVELKDINLPENMKRVIAHQAEAERDRRAVVTRAKGELEASVTLQKAAANMSKDPAALQLRLYQTMGEIASENNSTTIITVPIEILRAFDAVKNVLNRKK